MTVVAWRRQPASQRQCVVGVTKRQHICPFSISFAVLLFVMFEHAKRIKSALVPFSLLLPYSCLLLLLSKDTPTIKATDCASWFLSKTHTHTHTHKPLHVTPYSHDWYIGQNVSLESTCHVVGTMYLHRYWLCFSHRLSVRKYDTSRRNTKCLQDLRLPLRLN